MTNQEIKSAAINNLQEKIYDKNGESKTLPISEIHMSNDSYKIKLGFKKTSFTEIIKHDIGGKTYVTNQ